MSETQVSVTEKCAMPELGLQVPLVKKPEEAAMRTLKRERNPALLHADDFFDEVEEAKSLSAGLVNCRTEEVAVMPSASYGFASLLNKIKGKKSYCATASPLLILNFQ